MPARFGAGIPHPNESLLLIVTGLINLEPKKVEKDRYNSSEGINIERNPTLCV